ncbi:MAG: IgGFc-binding protein [Myxococcota bacterium]
MRARLFMAFFLLGFLVVGCTTGGDPTPMPEPDDPGLMCTPGQAVCDGFLRYVCGPSGERTQEELCPGACFTDGCGTCRPGQWRCDGEVSTRCDREGRWEVVRDCAATGAMCGEAGVCADPCGEAAFAESNVGCEFWAAPLANLEGPGELDFSTFDFRVAVANANDTELQVRVFRGERQVASRRVGPDRVETVVLPWVDDQSRWNLARGMTSFAVEDGAYRVVTDLPATVFQFNPYEYESDRRFSFSNDATLLLPAHGLSGDYVGVSYAPVAQVLPGYLAVVATRDTRVEITPSAPVAAEGAGLFFDAAAGETVSVDLLRGQVLHLLPQTPPECTEARADACEGESCFCADRDFDLTGTRVAADQPVALFGGHVCANVPANVGACDHLEAQIPPLESWGKTAVAQALDAPEAGRRNILRLVAGQEAVEVRLDPAVDGVDLLSLGPLEHADLSFRGVHAIDADGPMLAVTYMVGQEDAPRQERGDPSMTALIPTEQYGDTYLFVAPESFGDGGSFLAVVRPVGADVRLDGVPLDATWRSVGEGREEATVGVRAGVHRLRSSAPVSAVSFGLGRFTSYAYPSGFRLQRINLF